jgi:hypothetical protein
MATVHDFMTEAAEYDLAATVDRVGSVRIVDDCGRVLVIDDDEPEGWRLAVYRHAADWPWGIAAVDDELLDGTNVRVMFAHALQIANRVSTVETCADCERSNGPGAVCRCEE